MNEFGTKEQLMFTMKYLELTDLEKIKTYSFWLSDAFSRTEEQLTISDTC